MNINWMLAVRVLATVGATLWCVIVLGAAAPLSAVALVLKGFGLVTILYAIWGPRS